MGLDQWIEKNVYVGANYPHRNVKLQIEAVVDEEPLEINTDKVTYITEEVLYMRKANAIHAWFERRLGGPLENCRKYSFTKEDMADLLSDVRKVLKNPELAEEILPTHSGFFFGSLEYDQWYFEDLKAVEEELSEALKDRREHHYIYHAWW